MQTSGNASFCNPNLRAAWTERQKCSPCRTWCAKSDPASTLFGSARKKLPDPPDPTPPGHDHHPATTPKSDRKRGLTEGEIGPKKCTNLGERLILQPNLRAAWTEHQKCSPFRTRCA